MYKTLPVSSYNFKIDLKENNYIILINMKFILTIYKFDINGMIYIGSTWNYDTRLSRHKYSCYNENSKNYYCHIYKYIRENNVDWNDIIIEDIYNQELNEKNKLLKRQTEQIYIDKYDSKNNGLNTINAYITKEERKEQLKKNNRLRLEQDREKILTQKRIYNNNNKEYQRKYQHQYHEKYKEEINKKNRLRYQHKKNVKICNEIVNELIDSLF